MNKHTTPNKNKDSDDKTKLNITYSDGKICIELSKKAIKILRKFIVNTDSEKEIYFTNKYYSRYYVKSDIRGVLTETGELFFNKDVLSENVSFRADITSIHQFGDVKKELERQFKAIIDFYLNYDFTRGEDGL